MTLFIFKKKSFSEEPMCHCGKGVDTLSLTVTGVPCVCCEAWVSCGCQATCLADGRSCFRADFSNTAPYPAHPPGVHLPLALPAPAPSVPKPLAKGVLNQLLIHTGRACWEHLFPGLCCPHPELLTQQFLCKARRSIEQCF